MKQLVLIMLALLPTLNMYAQMEKSERYTRGWSKLQEIDGEAGENVVNNLESISPELVQFTLEYAFADIHSRKGLDRRYRQIATVAALATLGNASSQLKFHIGGALNVGVTEDEIKEIMLLMTVYAGFPAAINGMNALKEVAGE